MQRRSKVVALAAIFTVASATAAAAANPPTVLKRTGPQSSFINQPLHNGTWDLRGATWTINKSGYSYPIRSESVTNGVILGGKVVGPVPRNATRDSWYNGSPGPAYNGEAVRLTMTDTPNNTVRLQNTNISDFEDGYDPQAVNDSSTVILNHVRATMIRDDAIENEGSGLPERPASLTLKSSLIDGTFTAFGMRPPGSSTARNGSGNSTFRVEDSLVWVKPMPLGPKYGNASLASAGRVIPDGPNRWLGNYGFWKWSNKAPKNVVVRNAIFRLDLPSYSSQHGMDWPDGTYQNVTLVWTGKQPYASAGGFHNTVPSGVKVTRDLSVWTDARRAWLNGDRTPVPGP